MFNNLVESTAQHKGARAGAFFAGTAAMWMLVLSALIVIGIFTYDAKLSADFEKESLRIAPPPSPPPPPPAPRVGPPVQPKAAAASVPGIVAVREAPAKISQPPRVPTVPSSGLLPSVPGSGGGNFTVPGTGEPLATGESGNGSTIAPPPPPPPVRAEPTPPPKPQPVSEGVLAGRAIRRVQPAYPAMAKAANIEGSVIVEVTVSEKGQVISARVLSGHPLLREAAVSAARQWVFSPTLLSRVPVKVVGSITFNFKRA